MRNPFRSLLFAAFATAAFAASYNVRDFGATGDGATKDTRAFQQALDTCAVNGGGEVLVPAGKYLIGSIQIGNRTLLRLEKDSVLAGTADLADYPLVDVRWEGRWQPGHRGLIYASAADHIGIVGPGRIEGSVGPPPPPAPDAAPAPGRGPGGRARGWGTNGPDGTRNPVVIETVSCDDVRWEDFTVTQGGNWATHPVYCTNVVIKKLNITGGRDGIDVDSCKGVLIDGCTIENGDDCISLKSGRGMDGARLSRPCEDIVITNCTLTGVRFACVGIGSETSGGVRNVRIEHCKLKAHTHTVYIKTRIGRGGVNENISGNDLEILGGDFLRINLTKGGNTITADDPVEGLIGYPVGRNFNFSNIRMNGGKALVVGTEVSAKQPLHGFTLTHVTGAHSGITLANMTDVVLKDIVLGVAPAKPVAPTAAGQPAPGPVFGIVNVTGTGLEGATLIPAPVDPPIGNAAGFAPGSPRPPVAAPRGP
jgi:polygalacturonase